MWTIRKRNQQVLNQTKSDWAEANELATCHKKRNLQKHTEKTIMLGTTGDSRKRGRFKMKTDWITKGTLVHNRATNDSTFWRLLIHRVLIYEKQLNGT